MIQAVSRGFKLAVTKQNSPYDCKGNSCRKSVTSTAIPPPTVFLPIRTPHHQLSHSGAAQEKVIAEPCACVLVRVHRVVAGDPAPGDASATLSAAIATSHRAGTGRLSPRLRFQRAVVCTEETESARCTVVSSLELEYIFWKYAASFLRQKRRGGRVRLSSTKYFATGSTKMALINKSLQNKGGC